MSRFPKFVLLSVLVLFALACGLISNPISQAQNLASTAQAAVTSMPIQTFEALPSAMPDIGNYMNPSGTPVTDWKGVPIMPQATAGQEFNDTTYSFKASGVTVADVQTFYSDQLTSLGWSSAFGAQGGSQGGLMLFTKESSVLSITVTQSDNETTVLLLLQ